MRLSHRGWLFGVLVLTCLLGTGCGQLPKLQGQQKKMVDVTAEYLGLDGQRVAVMVAADGQLLYKYPQAPSQICRAVTGRIASHVPGINATIPDQIMRFQNENPYWQNIRYGELVKKMDVDRVVLIDLVEYRTHEPGNAHLWQGIITANVGVIDASAADPDNFVFYNTVEVRFPEQSTVGLVDSDEESIQVGMLVLFARKAGGLFFDHQTEAPK
jgi:hypothetical protein